MKFYKCNACGKIIITSNINDAVCCDTKMEELIPNTVEAAVEKHIPVCEINGDKILVKVGEVEHPMSNEHYISLIAKVSKDKYELVNLNPGEEPECNFDYEQNVKIYAYCNLHGLWVKDLN